MPQARVLGGRRETAHTGRAAVLVTEKMMGRVRCFLTWNIQPRHGNLYNMGIISNLCVPLPLRVVGCKKLVRRR